MMAKILYIIGSLPFVVLGLLHVLYTLQDISEPAKLVPRDTGLIDAMRASPLRLTAETDMWRAWLGFNLSHGLGAIFFGSTYLILALTDMTVFDSSPAFAAIGVIVSACYLVIAKRYWFSIPQVGTGLGFAAFIFAGLFSGGLL